MNDNPAIARLKFTMPMIHDSSHVYPGATFPLDEGNIISHSETSFSIRERIWNAESLGSGIERRDTWKKGRFAPFSPNSRRAERTQTLDVILAEFLVYDKLTRAFGSDFDESTGLGIAPHPFAEPADKKSRNQPFGRAPNEPTDLTLSLVNQGFASNQLPRPRSDFRASPTDVSLLESQA